MRSDILKFGLLVGMGIGFTAGKLDLDVRIREAIQNANQNMARMNAKAMADELEGRKLAVAPIGRADG